MFLRLGLSFTLLSSLLFTLAQPSCESLIVAWEEATADAQSYSDVITVTRKNSGNELLYQEGKHYRKEGELVREVVSERSALPFPIPPRGEREEENDGGAEAFCEGASVSPLDNGDWFISIVDNDSGLNNWRLTFSKVRDRYVPILVEGDFDVDILVFSLEGSFSTEFKDWVFVPNPEER